MQALTGLQRAPQQLALPNRAERASVAKRMLRGCCPDVALSISCICKQCLLAACNAFMCTSALALQTTQMPLQLRAQAVPASGRILRNKKGAQSKKQQQLPRLQRPATLYVSEASEIPDDQALTASAS